MMSLQSSTHSSQTKTDGPAISLRTSCWLLPQKEQYSSLPSSCLPRVSSTMPHALVCRDTGCRSYSTPVSNGKILFQLNQLPALPAAESHQGLTKLGQLPALFEDPVHNSVVARLLAAHEVVAVGVPADLVERLARVQREDLVQAPARVEDLARMDLDVGGLAMEAAERLVDHDARMRQRKALALGASRQQHRAHRGRLPHADRADVGLDELHRVVDRKAGRHCAARRVDVQVDVLVRVLGLEQHAMGDEEFRHVIRALADDEDHALLEQPRVDVVGALAAGGLFDHHRDHVQRLGMNVSAHGHPTSSDAASAPKFMMSLKLPGWSLTFAALTTQSTAWSSSTDICSWRVVDSFCRYWRRASSGSEYVETSSSKRFCTCAASAWMPALRITSFRMSPSATRRRAAGSNDSRGGSCRASRLPLRRRSSICMSRISASTSARGTAMGFAASSCSMTCALSRDLTAWASSRSMFSRTSARSASTPPSPIPKAAQKASFTSGRLLSSTLRTMAWNRAVLPARWRAW